MDEFKTTVTVADRKPNCSCAACRGFEPWVSRFAGCIQQGWFAANNAVNSGTAMFVPFPEDD